MKKKLSRKIEKAADVQRKFKGRTALIVSIIAVLFSFFEIWVNSVGIMPGIYRNAVHLSFLLILGFLLYPAFKKSPRDKFTIFDIILVILGIAVGIYILLFEEELHLVRGSVAITRDYIFALITVLLLLEATRRAVGPTLPGLSIFFLIYAHFGPYFPGIFARRGLQWTRILYRLYLTDEGIFGVTLNVSATFIFMFILFGAFLEHSGVSGFFNDFAMAVAGKRRGGPAQVAVVSSSLMGTMSGSAVANVATTGAFTIPLMKKIGYTKNFAGAVEAAASTGGMIMPPIMGAAAFIMSAYLGISYVRIMLAGIIPALFYYLGIFVSVDLEARRLNLKGLPADSLPRLIDVIKHGGHLIIPVIIVICTLVVGRTPVYAAFTGIISTIIVSWFKKDTRMNLTKIVLALDVGARKAVQVGLACACCGFIVGVAAMTGIGSVVAYNIFQLAHGSLPFALLLIMGASIILSMGLPSTACYIVVATVAAPALIKMEVIPLAAHFFVFYFGCLSNITPPVALASYTAAGLSGGNPTRVAWNGLKLAIAGFLVPFLYVYNPMLLLEGVKVTPFILSIITGGIGVVCLGIAAMNYLGRKLFIYERIMIFAGAVLLAFPGFNSDIWGAGAVILAFILYYLREKNWSRVKI